MVNLQTVFFIAEKIAAGHVFSALTMLRGRMFVGQGGVKSWLLASIDNSRGTFCAAVLVNSRLSQ